MTSETENTVTPTLSSGTGTEITGTGTGTIPGTVEDLHKTNLKQPTSTTAPLKGSSLVSSKVPLRKWKSVTISDTKLFAALLNKDWDDGPVTVNSKDLLQLQTCVPYHLGGDGVVINDGDGQLKCPVSMSVLPPVSESPRAPSGDALIPFGPSMRFTCKGNARREAQGAGAGQGQGEGQEALAQVDCDSRRRFDKSTASGVGNNAEDSSALLFSKTSFSLQHPLTLEELQAGLRNLSRTGSGYDLNFTHLDLMNKGLSDISLIEYFPALRTINIAGNYIQNVELFGAMPYLEAVNVSRNEIKIFGNFQAPVALRQVNFSRNRITSLVNIDTFWALTEGSSINDAAGSGPVMGLLLDADMTSYVKGIAIYATFMTDNELTSAQGFEACPHLKILDLSFNNIETIDNLSCPSLVALFLNNNVIQNIMKLDGCRNLRALSLTQNKIAQLKPLRYLSTLNELWLQSNKIGDIQELNNLKPLIHLNNLYVDPNPFNTLGMWRRMLIFILPQLCYLDGDLVDAGETMLASNTFNPSYWKVYHENKMSISLDLACQPASVILDDIFSKSGIPPVVLLVGPPMSQCSKLAATLKEKFRTKIQLGGVHSTATTLEFPNTNKDIPVSYECFLDMKYRGEFLSTSHILGRVCGFATSQLVRAAERNAILVASVPLGVALSLYKGQIGAHIILVMPTGKPDISLLQKKSSLQIIKDSDVKEAMAAAALLTGNSGLAVSDPEVDLSPDQVRKNNDDLQKEFWSQSGEKRLSVALVSFTPGETTYDLHERGHRRPSLVPNEASQAPAILKNKGDVDNADLDVDALTKLTNQLIKDFQKRSSMGPTNSNPEILQRLPNPGDAAQDDTLRGRDGSNQTTSTINSSISANQENASKASEENGTALNSTTAVTVDLSVAEIKLKNTDEYLRIQMEKSDVKIFSNIFSPAATGPPDELDNKDKDGNSTKVITKKSVSLNALDSKVKSASSRAKLERTGSGSREKCNVSKKYHHKDENPNSSGETNSVNYPTKEFRNFQQFLTDEDTDNEPASFSFSMTKKMKRLRRIASLFVKTGGQNLLESRKSKVEFPQSPSNTTTATAAAAISPSNIGTIDWARALLDLEMDELSTADEAYFMMCKKYGPDILNPHIYRSLSIQLKQRCNEKAMDAYQKVQSCHKFLYANPHSCSEDGIYQLLFINKIKNINSTSKNLVDQQGIKATGNKNRAELSCDSVKGTIFVSRKPYAAELRLSRSNVLSVTSGENHRPHPPDAQSHNIVHVKQSGEDVALVVVDPEIKIEFQKAPPPPLSPCQQLAAAAAAAATPNGRPCTSIVNPNYAFGPRKICCEKAATSASFKCPEDPAADRTEGGRAKSLVPPLPCCVQDFERGIFYDGHFSSSFLDPPSSTPSNDSVVDGDSDGEGEGVGVSRAQISFRILADKEEDRKQDEDAEVGVWLNDKFIIGEGQGQGQGQSKSLSSFDIALKKSKSKTSSSHMSLKRTSVGDHMNIHDSRAAYDRSSQGTKMGVEKGEEEELDGEGSGVNNAKSSTSTSGNKNISNGVTEEEDTEGRSTPSVSPGGRTTPGDSRPMDEGQGQGQNLIPRQPLSEDSQLYLQGASQTDLEKETMRRRHKEVTEACILQNREDYIKFHRKNPGFFHSVIDSSNLDACLEVLSTIVTDILSKCKSNMRNLNHHIILHDVDPKMKLQLNAYASHNSIDAPRFHQQRIGEFSSMSMEFLKGRGGVSGSEVSVGSQQMVRPESQQVRGCDMGGVVRGAGDSYSKSNVCSSSIHVNNNNTIGSRINKKSCRSVYFEPTKCPLDLLQPIINRKERNAKITKLIKNLN